MNPLTKGGESPPPQATRELSSRSRVDHRRLKTFTSGTTRPQASAWIRAELDDEGDRSKLVGGAGCHGGRRCARGHPQVGSRELPPAIALSVVQLRVRLPL
jgi:hypothetical protein